MNYYRDYRCELIFDSVTGQLTIKSDREVLPFVNEVLSCEKLLNTSFTNYSTVRDVKYSDTYTAVPTTSLFKEFPLSTPPPFYSNLECKTEHYSSDSEYTATCESIISEDIDPTFQAMAPYSGASTALVVKNNATTTTLACNDVSSTALVNMGSYYTLRSLLSELQQLECKSLVKLLIRAAIPAKKSVHPYKDGENSRPEFWPSGVPHRQPDHMSKDDRLNLLYFFLTQMSFEDVLIVCNQFKNSLPKRKQMVLYRILNFLTQER